MVATYSHGLQKVTTEAIIYFSVSMMMTPYLYSSDQSHNF